MNSEQFSRLTEKMDTKGEGREEETTQTQRSEEESIMYRIRNRTQVGIAVLAIIIREFQLRKDLEILGIRSLNRELSRRKR